MRKRMVAGAVSALVYAVILTLSSLPSSSLPSGIPDFIPHGIEYFVLAFYFIQCFDSPRRFKTAAAAWLIVGVLAFLDERHQLSSPGRFFSWLDILFDLAGALAGMIMYTRLARKSNKPGRRNGGLWQFLLLQR